MRFSVIITNFNYGQFISEAIESVLNQSYNDFELIVVDDASTDDSVEIVNRYIKKDKRIRLIENKESVGQNAAYQSAVKIANGDIICSLDSDDYYLPDMLKFKDEMYRKNAGCVLVDSALTIDGHTNMVNPQDGLDYQSIFMKYGYLYAHNNTSGLSITKDYVSKFLPLVDVDEVRQGLDCVLMHIALTKKDGVVIDRRLSGVYRVHENDVYDIRKMTRNGGYLEYYPKLTAFSRKQIIARGYSIPKTDSAYYEKIIDDVWEKISTGRIVIYGTSLIAFKMINAIEKKGGRISYMSDRAGTRRDDQNYSKLSYPWIEASELKNHKDEFDFILIASRQLGPITGFLKKCGFVSEIVTFPL